VLAHKLLTLTPVVVERERVDMIQLNTGEITRAMGLDGPAKLEDVREFVQDVVLYLQGYGLNIVCGCGYLSLMVSHATSIENAVAEERELASFALDNLDQYLEEWLMENNPPPESPVRQMCEIVPEGQFEV
jgi:hypothetical protein